MIEKKTLNGKFFVIDNIKNINSVEDLKKSIKSVLVTFKKGNFSDNKYYKNLLYIYNNLKIGDDISKQKKYLIDFINNWLKYDLIFIDKVYYVFNNNKLLFSKYAWLINNLLIKYDFYVKNNDIYGAETIVDQLYYYGMLTKDLLKLVGSSLKYKLQKFMIKPEFFKKFVEGLNDAVAKKDFLIYRNICAKALITITPNKDKFAKLLKINIFNNKNFF